MARDNEVTTNGTDAYIDRPKPSRTPPKEVTGNADISNKPSDDSSYLTDETNNITLAEAEAQVASLLNKTSKTPKEMVSKLASEGNFNFNQLRGIFNRSKSRSVTTIPAWFTRNVSMTSMLKIHNFQRTTQMKYMSKSLSLAYKRTSLLRGIYDKLSDVGDILIRKTDAVKVNTGVSAEVNYEKREEENDPLAFAKDMAKDAVKGYLKDTGKGIVNRVLGGKTIGQSLNKVRENTTGVIHESISDWRGEDSRLTKAAGAIHRALGKIPGRGLVKEGSWIDNNIKAGASLYNNYAPDFIKDKFGFKAVRDDKTEDKRTSEQKRDDFSKTWREEQISLLKEIRDDVARSSKTLLPGERTVTSDDIATTRRRRRKSPSRRRRSTQVDTTTRPPQTRSKSQNRRRQKESTPETPEHPTVEPTTREETKSRRERTKERVNQATESTKAQREKIRESVIDHYTPETKEEVQGVKSRLRDRLGSNLKRQKRRAAITARRLLRKGRGITPAAHAAATATALTAGNTLAALKSKVSSSTQHYKDKLAESLHRNEDAHKAFAEHEKELSQPHERKRTFLDDLEDKAKGFLGDMAEDAAEHLLEKPFKRVGKRLLRRGSIYRRLAGRKLARKFRSGSFSPREAFSSSLEKTKGILPKARELAGSSRTRLSGLAKAGKEMGLKGMWSKAKGLKPSISTIKDLIPSFGKKGASATRVARAAKAAGVAEGVGEVAKMGRLARLGLGVGKMAMGGIGGLIGDAVLDKLDNQVDAHFKQGSVANRLGHTATAAGHGAITGAAIGSFIPFVGTTIGAAVGAGAGALLANTDLISKGFHAAGEAIFGTKAHVDNQGKFVPGKDGAMGTISKGFQDFGMMFAKAGAASTGMDISTIKNHVGGPYQPNNYNAAVTPDGNYKSRVGDNATFRVATSPNRYKITNDGAYKATLNALPKPLLARLNETHNQGLVYAVYSTAKQFGAKQAARLITDVWTIRPSQTDDELIDGIFEVRSSSLNKGDRGRFANRVQATFITSKEHDLAKGIASGRQTIDYDALAASTADARGNSLEAANDNAQYQTQSTLGANSNLPRGLRNNNPGNIRWAKMFKQYGATPESSGDNPGFAVFPSMEEGVAQMRNQIGRYQTESKWGKIDTVRDIIAKWAPPDENNTKQYIDFVAKQLGVNPTDHLGLLTGKQVSTVMKAISVMENGNQAKTIFPVIDKVLAPETLDDKAAVGQGSDLPTPNALSKPSSANIARATVPSSRESASIVRNTPTSSSDAATLSATRGSVVRTSTTPANSNTTLPANSDPKLISHTESISNNTDRSVALLQRISDSLEAQHALAKQTAESGASKAPPVVVNNMNNTTIPSSTRDSLSFSNNREKHAHIG